jgi:hypothetical protein
MASQRGLIGDRELRSGTPEGVGTAKGDALISGDADDQSLLANAWRRTFKRRATRAGFDPSIGDAICGHSPRTVADVCEIS